MLRYLHGNSVDTPRLFYVLRTVPQHDSIHTMRAKPYRAAQLSLQGQHNTFQHGTTLIQTANFAYRAVLYRARTGLSCRCERSINVASTRGCVAITAGLHLEIVAGGGGEITIESSAKLTDSMSHRISY